MHSSFPLRVSTAMFELWRKGRRWACRKTTRVKVFAKLKLRFFDFCLKWLRKETDSHLFVWPQWWNKKYWHTSVSKPIHHHHLVFLSLFWKQHFTWFVDFTAVQLLVVKEVGSVPLICSHIAGESLCNASTAWSQFWRLTLQRLETTF